MTELSGKFDYSTLKFELKEQGIKTKDLSSAVSDVMADNNIDSTDEIEGSKKIKVYQSVFSEYGAETESNVEEANSEALLSSYTNVEAIASQNYQNLPEIYNDDEYEVADYDEFYGFAEESEEDGMTLDEFKENYENSSMTAAITDEAEKEEFLNNLFAQYDTNSDELLTEAELASMYLGASLSEKEYGVDTVSTGGEDLLGNGMMDMDMSGDSFNPQG